MLKEWIDELEKEVAEYNATMATHSLRQDDLRRQLEKEEVSVSNLRQRISQGANEMDVVLNLRTEAETLLRGAKQKYEESLPVEEIPMTPLEPAEPIVPPEEPPTEEITPEEPVAPVGE